MANFVFNVGLGKVAEKAADGATLKLMLLRNAAADATMKDYDTVQDLLDDAGVDEANFTNYGRETLTTVTVTVDDTNDRVDVKCDDVTFNNAGGTTDNTIEDAIIYEEVTNDTDNVPLVCLDASFTTDGSDVTLQFNAQGFFSAS